MALRLLPAAPDDYAPVKALYTRAFPPEERPPFFLLRRRAERGRGELLILRDGGCFVGFLYLVTCQDMVYLFFFAIDEPVRGLGHGSAALALLRERCRGKRLFLAREQLDPAAPNLPQRVSRRGFYLRAGFTDWPLRIKEADVIYDVMGIGAPITPGEYHRLITGWTGRLLCRLVDMRLLEGQADRPTS